MLVNAAQKRRRGRHQKKKEKVLAVIGLSTTLFLFVWNSKVGSKKLRSVDNESSSTKSHCPTLMDGHGVPTFKTRDDLGDIVQREGFERGIELGVQQGFYFYARTMLQKWTSCKEYHLVDLWAPQANYKDIANVDANGHELKYQETLANLKPWEDKTHVCRNFTTTCVNQYEDNYFDFIYVDARHDFKGVYEDLTHYWPKLKVGGIISGHDYVEQSDVLYNQDWTTNYDGTVDETGTVVKGAVDKFAAEVCRQVTVSYRESNWNTWALRK